MINTKVTQKLKQLKEDLTTSNTGSLIAPKLSGTTKNNKKNKGYININDEYKSLKNSTSDDKNIGDN